MNKVVVEVRVLVTISGVEIFCHDHSVFYISNVMS